MKKLNIPAAFIIHGASFFAVLTLILGGVLATTFPMQAELADGYRTPIIAFEFAKTEADLIFLSGDSKLSQANRAAMHAGHHWDMFFPFAYAGFLVFLLLQFKQPGPFYIRHPYVWLGIIVALTTIPFDIKENLILMRITDALAQSESVKMQLLELQRVTWLKWGALGASIGMLALAFKQVKEKCPALISAFVAGSVFICWASDTNPYMAECMSLCIFLFFFIFALKSFNQSKRLFVHNS